MNKKTMMKKKTIRIVSLSLAIAVILVAAGTFFLPSVAKVAGQDVAGQNVGRGWRVFVRTSPCSGRFDWLSVAREAPPPQGGGLSTYVPYETVLGRAPAGVKNCLESNPNLGCTFAEAETLREALRFNSKLSDYCCHDYSVWKNSQTDKLYVALVRTGTPGAGQEFVKGNLCCEEAEALAGTPGVCSGTKTGGKGGANTGGGFNGSWNVRTDLGNLEISMTQSGNRVTGTFKGEYGSGNLDGTVNGKVLRFKWQSGEDTGTGEATISADGQSFNGFLAYAGLTTRTSFSGTKSPS